jgi:hypothetical protein
MSLLRAITSGLGSLFRKEQVDRELDEELRGFLQMAVEEKMKQGMSRKDALRAVRLEVSIEQKKRFAPRGGNRTQKPWGGTCISRCGNGRRIRDLL